MYFTLTFKWRDTIMCHVICVLTCVMTPRKSQRRENMSKKKKNSNPQNSNPKTENPEVEKTVAEDKKLEMKKEEKKETEKVVIKEKGFKGFLKRKDIEISLKRYGIDALGAMAQGLFCSLLIGTIINTIGTQFNIGFLTQPVATVGGVDYTVGGLAMAMSGAAMAVAIAHALKCPPLVLFSMITVGFAANALGKAGGPLAVLFIAIIASECGKAISKETKISWLLHL